MLYSLTLNTKSKSFRPQLEPPESFLRPSELYVLLRGVPFALTSSTKPSTLGPLSTRISYSGSTPSLIADRLMPLAGLSHRHYSRRVDKQILPCLKGCILNPYDQFLGLSFFVSSLLLFPLADTQCWASSIRQHQPYRRIVEVALSSWLPSSSIIANCLYTYESSKESNHSHHTRLSPSAIGNG